MGRGVALLALGLSLLGVAWIFATPLGQSPDEPSQYLRALTITQGRLLGPRFGLEPIERQLIRSGGPGPAAQTRWIVPDQRSLVVPAALSPVGEDCYTGAADVRGRCTEVTYNGDYNPLAYLLPAAAISTAHSWEPAMWRARVASLLPVVAFLVLALMLSGPGAGWTLVGLLAAITPAVLFIGSVINPSGLEATASLAFIAALLRLNREGARFGPWCWVALMASGTATILAWQLGLVFAALDLAVFAALATRSGLREIWSRHRPELLVTAGVLLTASAAYVVWAEISGVIHPTHVSFSQGLSGIHTGLTVDLPSVLEGAVGIFGQYDVPLPWIMLRLWWLAVLALVIGALWLARGRDRWVVAGVTVVALAFPVLMYAFTYQRSGFGLQGRYVLPVLALIPMVAGHTLDARGVRGSALAQAGAPAPLWRVSLLAFAAFQLIAWWENARHWSGTDALVLHRSAWTPPAGWGVWLAVAICGAAALGLGAWRPGGPLRVPDP